MANVPIRTTISDETMKDIQTLSNGRVNVGTVIESLVAHANNTGFAPFGMAVIRQDLEGTIQNGKDESTR